MKIEGRVGEVRYTDGDDKSIRLGNAGELLVNMAAPGVYEQVLRGRGFVYATAATGNTFAAVTTTNQFTVWNPDDSGVNLVVEKVAIGYVSATNVAGHIGYYTHAHAGSHLATAAVFSAFTEATPVNRLLGGGRASRMRFSPTTNTATTAPVYLGPVGISTAAMVATTVAAPFTMIDNVDGRIIVPPGAALVLAANAAIAIVAAVALYGLELPVQV